MSNVAEDQKKVFHPIARPPTKCKTPQKREAPGTVPFCHLVNAVLYVIARIARIFNSFGRTAYESKNNPFKSLTLNVFPFQFKSLLEVAIQKGPSATTKTHAIAWYSK